MVKLPLRINDRVRVGHRCILRGATGTIVDFNEFLSGKPRVAVHLDSKGIPESVLSILPANLIIGFSPSFLVRLPDPEWCPGFEWRLELLQARGIDKKFWKFMPGRVANIFLGDDQLEYSTALEQLVAKKQGFT